MLNPDTAFELAQVTMAERIREANHQRLICAALDCSPRQPVRAHVIHWLSMQPIIATLLIRPAPAPMVCCEPACCA